jgi:hypothetical protein
MSKGAAKDPLIISYLTLRRLVGWIAIMLPIVLLVSSWVSSRTIDIYVTSTTVVHSKFPDSVSGYYYTGMRNFLVGSLCALGVFLIGYNGHDNIDRWTTNIAGGLAICVAFFPTTPSVNPSSRQQVIGVIHLTCAGLLFVLLAWMALRFAKTTPGPTPETWWGRVRAGLGLANTWDDADADAKRRNKRKKTRDKFYRGCAVVILLSMGLALGANFLPVWLKKITPTLFWFETLAIFAFGLSWLIKGRSLLPVRRWAILGNFLPALSEPQPELQQMPTLELAAAAAPTGAEAPALGVSELSADTAPQSPQPTQPTISPQRAAELRAELS